jgi:hypothetical protein
VRRQSKFPNNLGNASRIANGLLVGWCLVQLAWHQPVTPTLLLPLYYLADATVTLFRRIARREPFWAAHRSHFYQRATDNGLFGAARRKRGVRAQSRAGCAGDRLRDDPSTRVAILLFVIGGIATALLMHSFSRRRPAG